MLGLIVDVAAVIFDDGDGSEADERPATPLSVHLEHDLASSQLVLVGTYFSKNSIARLEPLIKEQQPPTLAFVDAQVCPSPWTQ